MSLLASAPEGLAIVGWKRLVSVTIAFCLAPVAMGALGLGTILLLGTERLGDAYLHWGAFSAFALLSPALTWPVWAVIGGGAALLLRRNAYGALSAAALGTLAGGFAGFLIDQPLGAALGAVLATFHRFALALMRPMAF